MRSTTIGIHLLPIKNAALKQELRFLKFPLTEILIHFLRVFNELCQARIGQWVFEQGSKY